jgi:ATP citrate (pro-S)-lyase
MCKYKQYDVYFVQELGLIRKPASFMTSICDERGQELNYAGMPISDVSSSTYVY